MSKFVDPKTEQHVQQAKRVNYLSLLFLVGMLGTSFYFFLQLQQKKAELVEKTQMLADSTENLRRIRFELETAQQGLEAREESTMTVLKNVTNLVEEEDYAEAKKVATNFSARKDRRPAMSVNLYTFGVSQKEKSAVSRYLSEADARVVVDSSLRQAPAWLPNESTVYFYVPSAESTAKKLANGLQASTGMSFLTVLGPSSDAPAYHAGHYFNVHYVNSAMVIQQKEVQSKSFIQQQKQFKKAD